MPDQTENLLRTIYGLADVYKRQLLSIFGAMEAILLTEYLLSMLMLSTFFVEAAFALPAVAEAAMTVVVV